MEKKHKVEIDSVDDTQEFFEFLCDNVICTSVEKAIAKYLPDHDKSKGNKIRFNELLIIIGRAELKFELAVFYEKPGGAINRLDAEKIKAEGLKVPDFNESAGKESDAVRLMEKQNLEINKDLFPEAKPSLLQQDINKVNKMINTKNLPDPPKFNTEQ